MGFSLDGGAFGAGTAVQSLDVTGDGQPDTVIDWAGFTCEKAASAFSGTGGSILTVLVGDQRFDMRTKGWLIVPTPTGPVLPMQVHGSDCGGFGTDPCFEAAVWNGQRFMTIRPAP